MFLIIVAKKRCDVFNSQTERFESHFLENYIINAFVIVWASVNLEM